MRTPGAGPVRSAFGALREHDFARWARGRLVDVNDYLRVVKWHPKTTNRGKQLMEQLTALEETLRSVEEDWKKEVSGAD